jgi:hypothetical protein
MLHAVHAVLWLRGPRDRTSASMARWLFVHLGIWVSYQGESYVF